MLCFVHKINFEMEPKSLVSQFIFDNDLKNNIRFTKSPTDNKYKSKCNITSDSLLFNGIYLYEKFGWLMAILFLAPAEGWKGPSSPAGDL